MGVIPILQREKLQIGRINLPQISAIKKLGFRQASVNPELLNLTTIFCCLSLVDG